VNVIINNGDTHKYYRVIIYLPLHISKVTETITEEQEQTRCHLLFYCNSYRLNMFRALLCPSSGARDYDFDYHIGRVVLRLL